MELRGEEELGQAQFAELLQPILQEIADALAENHVVAIQNIKVVDGSCAKKLLEDEKQMNDVMDKILQEKRGKKEHEGSAQIIRGFLEKHSKELGLPPPSEGNEAVTEGEEVGYSICLVV
ncbi:Calcium-binding EF hand family protein [Tripterygium wilfordii]|uniref:Calcium-binding EF hand family protein n=1 Tax=Tripterygium wilfordii TaxID=458696 RepID=A0A7J7CZM5_TRIWF|nr:Calcium-binding EF hand family protein [Tripterygium wilfordii]